MGGKVCLVKNQAAKKIFLMSFISEKKYEKYVVTDNSMPTHAELTHLIFVEFGNKELWKLSQMLFVRK